jgi:GNAT superfamily N-acetyltransferase
LPLGGGMEIKMKIEVTDEIKKQDEDFIFQGLLEYNIVRLEDKNPKDLGVYLHDETGKKVAGLIGNTHGNWLLIKFLWVSEKLRGYCIGSNILSHAEQAAKDRGCRYSFLDTFGFQAPEFYKKHGYKEVFALESYPVTGKRYYFTKTL